MTPCYVFDFCKADYSRISSFLLDSDFSPVFESDNIEFIWSFIKSLIYEAMSLFIPKKQVKCRRDPIWFNSDIRHQLKCLRTLKRRSRLNSTPQCENKIQQLEDSLQLKLGLAKSHYETKLIESYHTI